MRWLALFILACSVVSSGAFVDFNDKMYKDAVCCEVDFAEECLLDHNYSLAISLLNSAKDRYKCVAFSDKKLKFRIDVDLLVAELLAHKDWCFFLGTDGWKSRINGIYGVYLDDDYVNTFLPN